MKKINVMQTLENYAEIKNRIQTNILPIVAKYFKADYDTFSYEIDNDFNDIFVVNVFDDYDVNKGTYYIPIEYINKENINIDDYRKQEIAYMRKKKELELKREKDALRKKEYEEYVRLCKIFEKDPVSDK